jgi:hypothetical protein
MKPPSSGRLQRVALLAVMLAAPLPVGAAPVTMPPPPSAAATHGVPAPAQPEAPAVPPQSPPTTTELGGVTVRGKRDLFSESDARMKKLRASLPDLDSDAGHTESLGQRVVDRAEHYLSSHRDPNALSDAAKAQAQHLQSMGGVDNQHDAGKPAIPQPDAKDYVDPLCQTGSCPP